MQRFPSSSGKTSHYSRVSSRMEEDDVPVAAAVVEHVLMVDNTDFTRGRPEVMMAGGPSCWTDDFFQEHTDIVAVFDYDLDQLKEIKVNETVGPWVVFLTTAAIVGFVWSIYLGLPVFVPLACALLFGAAFAIEKPMKRNLEKTLSCKVGVHTAVTRTGVRHVKPSLPNRPGFALDIPFEDILSVKIEQLHGFKAIAVRLTLASTDDGLEYITSGYCKFEKSQRSPEIKLSLIGLKEPVRFKKLIMATKDEPSSGRASRLLSRVEAFVDGNHDADEASKQALSELLMELREFNRSSGVSGVQYPDGGAIV